MAARITSVLLLACLTFATALRAADPVSFSKQIQPIFESRCWKCHGAAMQLSRLDLRTREGALKGGEHGPSLVAGNADQSRIYRLVSGGEKPAMPMDSSPLTPVQIQDIRSWIEQGAPWENSAPAEASAAPVVIEEMPIPPEARKAWAFQRPLRAPTPLTRN